jgi:hypothetical protein
MEIPLNQFEQYIDETILKRGLDYFKRGHVASFDEITPGEFEAVVEGNEQYTVSLKVRNNTVIENSCTCPYDYGSVCKHLAAVLFYMQQDELGLKLPVNKKGAKNKSATKRKTVSEQVDELLDSLSHDDLKKFIKEQSLTDAVFRRSFLSGFAHKFSGESPAMYRQQVKNILRSAMGRDRFIGWSNAGMVGKAVFGMLGMAMKHVESGNYMSAIFICLPVAEEMVKALDYADDSNGDIGSNIETAFEILYKIASEEIPEDVRLYFFKQCLDLHRKGVFSGWDWHLTILHLASLLAESDSEAESVFLLLDNPGLSEYQKEEAEDIKYELLKKMKGDTEAEKFMEQNIDNPELRRKAIDKALKGGKYDMAISLARDGISLDSKDKPGLAKEWYDWLLRVVIAQKDKPRIIEYAHFLFVDDFRQDQDYYSILKQHIEPAEWAGYVAGLVNEIKSKDRWSKFDVIGKIYITEKWWERLLELVSETKHLPYIQHYEQYLADKYPTELADLYELGIIDYLKRSVGRNHYKEACRYMRRMIKLGARDRVNKLVANLRKEYPLRTALIDELNKL